MSSINIINTPPPILIFGSGRSGTSWLCETLAKPFGYRLLFEPDQDHQIPAGHVLTDKFLTTQNTYPEIDHYLNLVFKNKINSAWLAQNSNRHFNMHLWSILIKRLIVKFVRSNLGMYYIQQKFPYPVINIIRDPYNTIYSQKRVNFPWLYDFSHFQKQATLCNVLLDLYGLDITAAKFDNIEKLAIRWCIENVFIHEYYKDTPSQNILTVYHESLKNNITLYRKILQRFRLTEPDNLDEIYKSPSSKTHPSSNIRQENKDTTYRSLLDKSEQATIQQVLELFRYQPKAESFL